MQNFRIALAPEGHRSLEVSTDLQEQIDELGLVVNEDLLQRVVRWEVIHRLLILTALHHAQQINKLVLVINEHVLLSHSLSILNNLLIIIYIQKQICYGKTHVTAYNH